MIITIMKIIKKEEKLVFYDKSVFITVTTIITIIIII